MLRDRVRLTTTTLDLSPNVRTKAHTTVLRVAFPPPLAYLPGTEADRSISVRHGRRDGQSHQTSILTIIHRLAPSPWPRQAAKMSVPSAISVDARHIYLAGGAVPIDADGAAVVHKPLLPGTAAHDMKG